MKYHFLIACALREESNGRFEDLGYPIVYTGLGKVNAAISLTNAISHFKRRDIHLRAILNLGTAGSAVINKFSTVLVSKFIQRDINCEPIAKKYITPFDELQYYNGSSELSCTEIPSELEKVVCGTGDSFHKFDSTSDYEIADMEGYALAKACLHFDLPIFSLKYISDNGDISDWKSNIDRASKTLFYEASNLLFELKRMFL